MPDTAVDNLFRDLPPRLEEELFTTLAAGGGARIERILSPPGQIEPGSWYDQEWDEWVMVVRGGAALEIDGEPGLVELGPGDHVVVPAHRRHRVASTAPGEPTLWLAVHFR
jgi:cupin 2 domain-containing protein